MEYSTPRGQSRQFFMIENCDRLLTLGLILSVFAIYFLTSSGRIDTIDGQWRFEVLRNILTNGTPEVTDPSILWFATEIGRGGRYYCTYGFSGSVIALPLVLAGVLINPSAGLDGAQFLFSLVSPILGSLTVGLLFVFYRKLSFDRKASLTWSLIFAFSSIFFPVTGSVFDQTQNAFFLLLAVFAAHEAFSRNSMSAAVIGGLSFAILANYKEAFFILFPGLLVTLGALSFNRLRIQVKVNGPTLVFCAGALLGFLLWIGYNVLRFEQLLPQNNTRGLHPPILGNPISGLLGLTISPGKGILFYSPVIIFAFLGAKKFRDANPLLADGVFVISVIWISLVASLSFFGGDWCWGPRYWVPVLPLLFLAAPYSGSFLAKGNWKLAVVGLSLIIQLLGLSVDHHRFFVSRGLSAFFWYDNASFYFKESALFSRIEEVRHIKNPFTTQVALPFRPGPYPDQISYCVFGPPPQMTSEEREAWMSRYPVFFLPRPWSLWVWSIDPEEFPFDRRKGITFGAVVFVLGIMLVGMVFRQEKKVCENNAATKGR